jgi:hypothetical protein
MEAFEILVVILSAARAVCLLLGIVLLVAVIKLVNKFKQITQKAEEVMDDVEAVSGFFRKSAGPVAITSLLSNIVSKVVDHKAKKGK